jgi:hypothetical protein
MRKIFMCHFLFFMIENYDTKVAYIFLLYKNLYKKLERICKFSIIPHIV